MIPDVMRYRVVVECKDEARDYEIVVHTMEALEASAIRLAEHRFWRETGYKPATSARIVPPRSD